jgi:hypothetical protein
MNPDNLNPNEATEFLWRRLSEDCPVWAIGVPVLFALAVVGLIVYFRPERKLIAAIIGLAVVGVISVLYLPLAFILRPFFSWLVILIPVMAVALFYVGMMYLKDARSVHPVWAIFLGMLRTAVYATLALVFLLPGCQHYEKQEYESKVIFLFDTSDSMFVVDGVPEEGKDPKLLPSRQDLILSWLNGAEDEAGRQKVPFMDKVMQKTPVTGYRFGAVLDETDIVNLHLKKEKTLDGAGWRKWLNPNKKDLPEPNFDGIKDDKVRKEKEEEYHKRLDLIDTLRAGTNIGGAALQMHKLENNSFLQAIVIVSDGQSNLGSEDARMDFINRVSNPKRPIPVITVGVGQFRLPAAIRIDDLQAPEETRPDDKFPVRVPVVGTNLHGEEFEVTLEARRVKDVTGKPVDDKAFELGPKKGKFKAEGGGDHPQDVVEFIIDVSDLKGIPVLKDDKGDLEGEWHFKATVPRNKKEAAFAEKEHVSETVKVQVQKRALRVLLFTSGATREYQFLRTILYREMLEKRMEVCIYNQQNAKEDFIDESVEPERLLSDFPTKLEPNPGQKYMSLSDYDVVVCFDPDWTKLTLSQRNNLNKWVANYGGGVIFVAGPIYSYQIARPGGHDLDSLLKIFPVVLKDNRLHALPGVAGLGHDTSRPYALTFTPNVKAFDFLRLEEDQEDPLYGWNLFFWKNANFQIDLARDLRPYKGFFTYYPVERIKPATIVIAAFVAGKEARIGDKTEAFKDQMPFIATMPYGTGKTMYVGSGEFWRMRSFKDGYHERLWIKMARYAAAGAREQKKYGRFLMSRNVPVGLINCEAQVKGANFLPLPADLRPTVIVKRIDKERDDKAPLKQFDMKAKPSDGDWNGYFIGGIQIKEPGEYEFQLPIPGTNDSLRQSVLVRKANPELDNVRTNFGYLYQLASEAGPLMKNLSPDARKRVDAMIQVPEGGVVGEKPSKRLFFPVASADAVADCLVQIQPKTDTVRGRFEDLWDAEVEWPTGIPGWVFWTAVLAPVALSLIGVLVFLLLRSWQGALGSLALGLLIGLVPVAIRFLTGLNVEIFWAVVLAPLAVGVIGLGILLLMRQWVSAIGFFALCGVLSCLGLLFAFLPGVTVPVISALVSVAALGYGIYLGIKKELFALGCVIFFWFCSQLVAGYLFIRCHEDLLRFSDIVWNESLPIGFSGLLVVAVSLLGIEWLARKLLRLA